MLTNSPSPHAESFIPTGSMNNLPLPIPLIGVRASDGKPMQFCGEAECIKQQLDIVSVNYFEFQMMTGAS